MFAAGQRLTACRILSASNIRHPSRISELARFTVNDLQPKDPRGLRSQLQGRNLARLRQVFRVANQLRKLDPGRHPKLDIRPTVAD